MNKVLIASLVAMLPFAANAQIADMSDEAALQFATAANACPLGVGSATFTGPMEVTATCIPAGATGFAPLLGAAAPAIFPGLVVLFKAIEDDDDSTDATSGTVN